VNLLQRMAARVFRLPTQRVVADAIRARYDAAQSGTGNEAHWAAADALDADAANSLAVRKNLRERSRYERENNGYSKGTLRTHANYVVGSGPTLRMETKSEGFNKMVEAAWKRWCKAVSFRRKLRVLHLAKTGDGESFARLQTNPNLRDPVKLDIVPLECDQCSSPYLSYGEPNHIDGIKFDEYGNPVSYDILKDHPGGLWSYGANEANSVPERFMLHWYLLERPKQHRGVPDNSSTLSLTATARRFREATVSAAETAASFGLMLETNAAACVEADEIRPLTELEIDHNMAVAAPMGWHGNQLKAEHPSTTYEGFNKQTVNEQSRPISMPRNVAMCDSSDYNFSSGQLDHHTYFAACDNERLDGDELIVEPTFEAWWAEAKDVYGWAFDSAYVPPHSFGWPAYPKIDPEKTAKGRKVSLSTGEISLRRVHAEDGHDFEEELVVMAKDYGVEVDEMRVILRNAIFDTSSPEPEGKADDGKKPSPPNNRFRRNGHAKV